MLESKAIFVTASEICIIYTLTGLVGGMAQPPSDVILNQIPRSYAAGFSFSGFDPLSQDFQLAKVTFPIAVPTIPYYLNAFIGGAFVRANAYYLPAINPLPEYPDPGTGRYEGAGAGEPTPGQFTGGHGGQSGGGGASGDWGVKPEPTGGAWYLPKNLLQSNLTVARDAINRTSGMESSYGLPAFFWVYEGNEPEYGLAHILNAPFSAHSYYGDIVAYPGLICDIHSHLIGFQTVKPINRFSVDAWILDSGNIYQENIEVAIWGNADFPGMFFPDRPGTIPVTPGFLVQKGKASNIPAIAALIGLRLWGKKRGSIL